MNIEHDENRSRFVVKRPEGEAYLAYRFGEGDSAKAVDFYSTFVPPTMRKQGLAEALVRTGLKWANSNSYQIKASCWYAAKFLP